MEPPRNNLINLAYDHVHHTQNQNGHGHTHSQGHLNVNPLEAGAANTMDQELTAVMATMLGDEHLHEVQHDSHQHQLTHHEHVHANEEERAQEHQDHHQHDQSLQASLSPDSNKRRRIDNGHDHEHDQAHDHDESSNEDMNVSVADIIQQHHDSPTDVNVTNNLVPVSVTNPVPAPVPVQVPAPAPIEMNDDQDDLGHQQDGINVHNMTMTPHGHGHAHGHGHGPPEHRPNTTPTHPLTHVHTSQFNRSSLASHTWSTDHVSEARRRMNTLIQRQQQAQEELKAAQENLDRANARVKTAKATIDITAASVHQGTEELTDALLQEPTHWNAMYRKLVEYRNHHGHVNVKRNPKKEPSEESDPDAAKIGSWVGRVRLEARRPAGHPDHIEPYKVIALNRLGFNWDPRENYWMERFEELKVYIVNNPAKRMPTRKTKLGVWCDGQVQEFNKFKRGLKPCYITQDRIDLLNSIGFVWDRVNSAWHKSFNEMKKYRDEMGHCHVPVNYGDKTLFRWVTKQRKKYKNYKEGKTPAMTEEHIKLLNEIDFFEPTEKRMAKYNTQRISDRNKNRSSKSRGRPKSTTLIPREALLVMPQLGAPIQMNVSYSQVDEDIGQDTVERDINIQDTSATNTAPLPPSPLENVDVEVNHNHDETMNTNGTCLNDPHPQTVPVICDTVQMGDQGHDPIELHGHQVSAGDLGVRI